MSDSCEFGLFVALEEVLETGLLEVVGQVCGGEAIAEEFGKGAAAGGGGGGGGEFVVDVGFAGGGEEEEPIFLDGGAG